MYVCINYLFQEELVHAFQITGTCYDLKSVVLPLCRFHSYVANFQAAFSLDFWGWLFVFFTFPSINAGQFRTSWRTQLCMCKEIQVLLRIPLRRTSRAIFLIEKQENHYFSIMDRNSLCTHACMRFPLSPSIFWGNPRKIRIQGRLFKEELCWCLEQGPLTIVRSNSQIFWISDEV